MLYHAVVMGYRVGIILRCLLVIAVGIGCLTVIANGMQETDGDGILIAFFMLCLYAGVVCGSLGNLPAFATILFIRNLGCLGMFIWAVVVTLLSIIIIPIVLTWNISALLLSLLGRAFRVPPFLRTVLCVVLTGGVFGGITMYVNNIINRQSGDTLIDNTTIEKKNVTNRYYVTNEHHYHTNDKDKEESEDENGYSELHQAVIDNDYNRVRLLVRIMYVDERDNDGNTPLHLAARYGHTKCVLILLEDGKADMSIVNYDGKTALDLAKQYGHEDCERAIREWYWDMLMLSLAWVFAI